jgi:cytochrome c551/c552
MKHRLTYTSRDVQGGCFVCHGVITHWRGPNTQGVAARHHDATGHEVWCEVVLSIRYGSPQMKEEPAGQKAPQRD